MTLEDEWEKNADMPASLPILLSHLHLDHTIGLTMFAPVFKKDGGVCIYTCSRDDRPLKEQVFGAFVPPYWPIPMDKYTQAEVAEIEEEKTFSIGVFSITPFRANHPDITLAFRITDGVKTMVYLLDNELPLMSEEMYNATLAYCNGVDLVIFDAAYLKEEYPAKVHWGHSTAQDGIKLALESGCKRMVFTHYSHKQSDITISGLEKSLELDETRFLFARDGMEIAL
jgi:ribonuclease BN (tRNA processing enzyme)